ncbi:Thioredoxin domain-containing protein [Cephalotus follicularis]|uniref:Thioredoxin-like protein HCF164, chloroplastic n=1 Tax=Cephalotus follicularis TaxID=3775 RepID=A0A1Q3BC21_CEPFO|nr:Thioredoxin domain-containing protein [Cephalotus follicularis]
MARVASNPLSLHRIRPNHQTAQSPKLVKTLFLYQNRTHSFPVIACQPNPNPAEPQTETSTNTDKVVVEPGSVNASSTSSADGGLISEFPNRSINKPIAVVATLAAVALFLSTRLDFGISLKDLSATALPYEKALSNGKPTVVEFYADWCEVCRELAPDVYKVEQLYKDRVNFVMLNVDNTKWEQELDEFGVEGIPHFAFLDKDGNEEGNVVGRLPRQYFLDNVDALSRGEGSIPHARVVGQYSSAEFRKVHQVVDPRSHS